MPFKKVNINGKLNMQDDPRDVGFNGFTSLQNMIQTNGRLTNRFGTGPDLNPGSYIQTIIKPFVSRRLQGVRVKATNTNNVTFELDDSSLTISGTMNATNIDAPGGDPTDLRSVFKPGDTVFLKYSTTCANDDEPYVINTVPAANKITFLAPVTDEVLNSSSQHFIIAFAYAATGATLTHIPVEDANDFDGRAFFSLLKNSTDHELRLTSIQDFGTIILDDYGIISYSDDIEINSYTDAVRISRGLDASPQIFRYVNRHFFNGVYKSVYNADCVLLYPRWMIDTAIPVVADNTFTLFKIANYNDFGQYVSPSVGSGVHIIKGDLDLNEDYTYKIVPVYDGTQEMPLSKNIIVATTASATKIPIIENKNAVIKREDGAIKIDITVDTSVLNPRTSSLNVYRAKGTSDSYYKIKSIYLGDNDPNQKTISDGEHCKRWFFWKGGDAMESGSANARTDLNALAFMYNGKASTIASASGSNDYQSKGWRKNLITADFDSWFTGSELTQHEVGMGLSSIWNKDSVDTGPVFAADDSVSGGSPDGGWYIAKALEYAKENVTYYGDTDSADAYALRDCNNDADGNMETDTPNYNIGGPYGDSGSDSGLDWRFVNTGDVRNLVGTTFGLHAGDGTTSSADPGGTAWNGGTPEQTSDLDTKALIVSGWVRAVNINHPSAYWKIYIAETNGDESPRTAFDSASGRVLLAQGKGGSENQNCGWTYFQRELTGNGQDLFIYDWMYTPDAWSSSVVLADSFVQVWGISLREKEAGYGLDDALTSGFATGNVLFAKNGEFDEFPNGALKGNLIQNHDEHSYPINYRNDRRTILDNYGPFVRTEINVPEAGSTVGTDDYTFSSSNYQIKVGATHAQANDNTVADAVIEFIDTGLPDGARNPMETATSTDVKFKYSTILNGRQFVANVKIVDDKDAEEYPNFIMFSEVNSPDIIPTTNYIQLQDLQGGEIVGIDSLMGDIVVFMTNGIFRLSIPNNNPLSWSLVESHKNIGCLHKKAIAKTANGIYFLSKSDIIFLDSGFSATPISYPIKDIYQTQSYANPSTLKLHHDVKYNRLILLYSNTTDTYFYMFDIEHQRWSREKHGDVMYAEFGIDDKNETYYISSSGIDVRKAVDTTEYRDKGSVLIDTHVVTGYEVLTSNDKNAIIRRVNINNDVDAGKGYRLLKTGVTGGTGTVAEVADGTVSLRDGGRAKEVQLAMDIGTSPVTEDKEKYIQDIEIEYE